MGKPPLIKTQTGYFEKKNAVITAGVLLSVIVLLICVVTYVTLFDVFKPEPKVEVQAQNNFKNTLHVVTDIDYKPYSYVDENGNYSGFDVELMNNIANRMQMNLDLRLMSWADAQKEFDSGNVDIIMNMESDMIINDPDMIATLPTTEKQYVVYGSRASRRITAQNARSWT